MTNWIDGGAPKPLVALVGRPNVGKSTLFNRLVGKRISLVHDTPGVTRDRIYGTGRLDDISFRLVDTGGLTDEKLAAWTEGISKQAKQAVSEANVVLMVVDAKAGLLPGDIDIAKWLRPFRKPVIILANKADNGTMSSAAAAEFTRMGIGDLVCVSAVQGAGLSDLYDSLAAYVPKDLEEQDQEDEEDEENVEEPKEESAPPTEIAMAVLGKPNAGKSSFVNALLGEERLLVSDIPGTTVDAVDSVIHYAGSTFRIIDTAGIRRKRSIDEDVEKMSVSAALGALDRAEVALLMIDAEEGITEQDLKIGSFIQDKSKACVVVINKWDLQKGKGDTTKYAAEIRKQMPFLAFAPIRFVSARMKLRLFEVLESAALVQKAYHQRVSTGKLNRMVIEALESHQPSMVKGTRGKIYYASQVSVAPPLFVFYCNDPSRIHFSYKRYLSNKLREAFDFKGSPLKLAFRARKEKKEKKR